jgi:SagB-type dehydrogenase family enzyme
MQKPQHATEVVLDYHQRTKHHLARYARSLGYLDWENQPNPFRFYADAPRLALPLSEKLDGLTYEALFGRGKRQNRSLALTSLAAFLELSLGLSAWKAYGASEWSLRMNPSSGNLHPTECYLLLPAAVGLPACIAHYNPFLHSLEIRARLDSGPAASFGALQGFAVILSSIFWREAWKYGERAYRYTQHDVGHALGALRFSAALQGWQLTLCPEIGTISLDQLLGFSSHPQSRGETERADCVCWVSTSDSTAGDALADWLATLQAPTLVGKTNPLSASHVDWPVIEEVATSCLSPGFARQPPASIAQAHRGVSRHEAEAIIRQRRSAQAYAAANSQLGYPAFTEMLKATLPNGAAPFDVLPIPSQIHLVLFVHQVDGLAPGLYCWVRDSSHLAALHSSCSASFAWQAVDPELPLYLLQAGDYRRIARTISCHQDIASDSAFSLGMLARFEANLRNAPWRYPCLFWEAGLIGQVLYLEAEEQGLRGTGIGCYFDDLMHDLLGLEDRQWQDLYHFTIGSPVADTRLQTKPPYHHLGKQVTSRG